MSGTLKGLGDYMNAVRSLKVKRLEYVVYAQPSLQNAQQLKEVLTGEVFARLSIE